MRSIFGWSYPPGAASDPFAPYNQVDGPCAVCGRHEVDCLCQDCPVCDQLGDPDCYAKHGMQRTEAQIIGLALLEESEAAAAAAEEAFYAELCSECGRRMSQRERAEQRVCNDCGRQA